LSTELKQKTMKKVLLAVAVIAFFASCSKDYTCTRTQSDGVTKEVTTYESLSRGNANLKKAECEATETYGAVTVAGGVWEKK
jgi:hypothetical protein